MTKRLLFPSLLVVATFLTGCPAADDVNDDPIRQPFTDEWKVEMSGPAAQMKKLFIGDRLTSDNFANRGDIEIIYANNTDQITIEMQRFTISSNADDAQAAFGRMQFWGYDIATPKAPKPEDAEDACWAEGVEQCYVRNYYEGQLQPVRDGVNFRVTIPAGWNGDLNLTTEDNLESGVDTYPDRSDIVVDGLAGSLVVDMDSGNIQVRMDPNTEHYAGCSANDQCIADGYPIGCGCSEPTNIDISNKSGTSSDMVVDVADSSKWYTVLLENRGTFSASDEFVCTATIDCGAFEDCSIDPDFAAIEYQERAEINYPGTPAIAGAGVRISLISEACAVIPYSEGPDDFDAEDFPEERRGDLEVCVGCLSDL